MKVRSLLATAVVCGLALVLTGCGTTTAPSGDLDTLSADQNNNGYPDVTPPDGIEFNDADNAKVAIINSLRQSDLGQVAAGMGVEPSLLSLVSMTVDVTIDLDYGGGITDVLNESESIAPFEKRFEIACPDSADISVEVVANIPFVGPQTVAEYPVELVAGQDYECGSEIAVESYLNNSGNPAVDVNVQ